MADFLQRYNNLKERVSGSDLEKLSDKEILELYEEAKEAYSEYDNMQLTVKLDGNSLYGVSASQYFSLHDYDIAEDITGSARHFAILIDVEINKFFQHWADTEESKQKNLEIIRKFYPQADDLQSFSEYRKDTVDDLCVYGDTDSRYVDMQMIHSLILSNGKPIPFPDVSPDGNTKVGQFAEFMTEHYINRIIADSIAADIEKRGANPGFLRMAHEVTSNGQAIFLTSKKYVLPLVWKDDKFLSKTKMKLQGVELKRGEMTKRMKGIIEKVLCKFVLENYSMEQIRQEIQKLYKYIKMRKDFELIMRITSVNMANITFDARENKYVSPKTHIQEKIAISWCNFIHDNGLEKEYRKPFTKQKMLYYYTKSGEVMGVPDDVEISAIPNLPEPDWDKMIKQTLVKSIMKYVHNENTFTDVEVDNFILGVKRLSLSGISSKH